MEFGKKKTTENWHFICLYDHVKRLLLSKTCKCVLPSVFIFIPPANKVWRYMGITLSVCHSVRSSVNLSVCQSVCLSVQSCPVHIFLMEKHKKFLLNTAYDLRVCHDFYPRSIGQVQRHSKEKCLIRVRSIYL